MNGGNKVGRPVVSALVASAILALSGLTACSAGDQAQVSSDTATAAKESPTPTPKWTPNIPEKKPQTPPYKMPEGAIPAKEAVDEFYAEYTVEEILERRRSNDPEDIKWARDMTLALAVEALDSQEAFGNATMEEYCGDNWLFRDVHSMEPDKLVDALDRLGHIGVAVTESGYTVSDTIYQKLDEEKSLKTIALGYGPDANGEWEMTAKFYEKEKGNLGLAQWGDPRDPRRTATIVKSETEQVGDESVEVITVDITGDPGFPGQTITRQYYLMPIGTLYGINGESLTRNPSLDPEDYNRPKYDKELNTYVTKDTIKGDVAGKPIRVPVLKQ